MGIITKTIHVNTKGFSDIVNLSSLVGDSLKETDYKEGSVTVFIPGSTAGITTIEFESGALQDLKSCIERLIPEDIHYQHDVRWGDGNGFSHVRSAFLGPSLSIPFSGGELMLGTWQQIVLIDFDNKPRYRDIILQFIGE